MLISEMISSTKKFHCIKQIAIVSVVLLLHYKEQLLLTPDFTALYD